MLLSLDADKWLGNEERFLMTEAFSGASIRHRQHLIANKSRLFADIGPMYITHGTNPSPQDIAELIELNGGQVWRIAVKYCVIDKHY